MRTVLPLLLLLACPLMMFACMRGMRGHGSQDAQTGQNANDEAALLREEVAVLREELARQKAREKLGGS
ncbi:MAG: DUF2933 domain-containing protein [Actinomycetota bacterium]